jgi:hemerythrin-like domain-containing protein
MADSFDLRRRWLVGVALLVPAAPVLAGTPRQLPPQKKAAPPPPPITEILMRDQGVLERVLLIYEAGIRRLGQGEDLQPVVFAQAGDIMRDFVHDYHEKAKEQLVFPSFKKAGRMVGLVDLLQVQHQAGRRLTERVLENAGTSRAQEGRTAMIEAMQASIALYRPHIARTTTDVLPTLRTLVTSGEFDELSTTMEKRELEAYGPDGFVKVAKRVQALEEKIGTHDLSQYTPKT